MCRVTTISCTTTLLMLVLLTILSGFVIAGPADSDLVKNLPGQPPVKFKHYAGYVKLRNEDQKALFYWFFEAQSDVAQRPLLLWLNGGPGCSSVAYGAAQELGPFLIRNGSNLELNKFSWNKVVNLLFLESPVGVGYSYTNRSEDLFELGDTVTAKDSYFFLLQWFHKFPHFRKNEFYIAGESYAGHFVPQLSELIYERNKGAMGKTWINFKGLMIGNAVLNAATDRKGFLDYAWTHAIISDSVYEAMIRECHADASYVKTSKLCQLATKAFWKSYTEIDVYSIYTPICWSLNKKSHSKLITSAKSFNTLDFWHNIPSGYDPCTEDYAVNFFNKVEVQDALHANVTKLKYPYSPCSNVIRKWNDSADSTLPILKKLLDAGMRIWVYSGDSDGRVPVTSTRYSLKELNYQVKEDWRSWYYKNQVAGWVTTYENGLIFATMRGAGHQVPKSTPGQSLALVSRFVSGTKLPGNLN